MFLYHICRFFVGKPVFRLDDACAQRQPQRFCDVALPIREKLRVPDFDLVSWNALCLFDPAVFRVQLQPGGRAEIRQAELVVLEFVHCVSLQTQGFFAFSHVFPASILSHPRLNILQLLVFLFVQETLCSGVNSPGKMKPGKVGYTS
jgi:hypothetical protein